MPSACRYLGFASGGKEPPGTKTQNGSPKDHNMGDTLSMIGLAKCSKREEESSAAWLLLAKDLGPILWRLEQSITSLNAMEKTKAKEEAAS